MPNDRLAIAHVTPYPWGAGRHEITTFVQRTTAELAARGHRVLIIAPSTSRAALRGRGRRLQLALRADRAINRFEILERDLSLADGELTPSLKVKRNVVYKRHAERVAALYEK